MAFEHRDVETGLVRGERGGATGDATTDDQDHFSPPRLHPGPWTTGRSAALLCPPPPARFGQGRDRVVVGVAAEQGVGVLMLDPGAVVLRPVGDPALAVVLCELVYPALAHVGNVADDPAGGVAGQV